MIYKYSKQINKTVKLQSTLTKIFLVLALLSLSLGLTTAQEIQIENPEHEEYYNDLPDIEFEILEDEDYTIQSIEIEYEIIDEGTNDPGVDSSDSESIESDYEEGYEETWFETFSEQSSDEDDWSAGKYELTISATLEDEDEGNEETVEESLNLSIDREDPSIGDTSFEAHDHGNVTVTWDVNEEDGFEREEYRLYRLYDDEEELVAEDGTGGTSSDTLSLVDQNEERIYDEVSYRAEIMDRAGNQDTAVIDEVQINDGIAPVIVSQSIQDEEYMNEESPTISFDLEDQLSGIVEANLTFVEDNSIFDDFEEPSTEEVSLEIDLEDLEDGDYEVDLFAADDEDNALDKSFLFVVDTEAPEPEASLIPDPESQSFIETRQRIEVEVEDSDGAVRAECYVNPISRGNNFGEADLEDNIFNCGHLEPELYSEGANSIYVRFEDRAGNQHTEELGEYIFDTEPPRIFDFDITPEYTNEEPNVTIGASDTGSEVVEAEYVFSENVDEGDGENIVIDDSGTRVEFDFQPDLRNEDDGEFEIFVRVRDQSGKWSSLEGGNFTLDRGALPDPSINLERIEVEDGNTVEIVDVENDGRVPLVNAYLEMDGIAAGESDRFRVEGQSSDSVPLNVSSTAEFGEYRENVTLISDTTRTHQEIDLIIVADQEEKEEVEVMLDDVSRALDYLEGNITELEEKGVSEEFVQELREAKDELDAEYTEAQASAEDGEYYEIASLMNDLESLSQEASQTTEEVQAEVARERRWFFIKLFTLLLVLSSGAGIFALYRLGYELETDQFDISELELNSGSFDNLSEIPENIRQRLEELMESSGTSTESDSDYDDIAWK